MASQFSEDGKYFAQISGDGKLKIWNTISNSFEQEFTPDFHLTTPCTCLHFLRNRNDSTKQGSPSPKKKKRRESQSVQDPNIVLGTTNGLLLVYSISRGNVDYTINSETSQSINCLSSTEDNLIYSGADKHVFEWNLVKRNLKSKWKAGNDKITAILAIPNSDNIVTASKTIKLWNVTTKEILKSFTGHSSDVVLLRYVDPKVNNDCYLLSGSKGDRLLSCWNLSETSSEKNAVANFRMEDVVQSLSLKVSDEGETRVCATVRSGVAHVFHQKLNGKCGKPIKPKTTIQVVSDTGQSDKMVAPIRIFGAVFRDGEALCIAHGTEIVITFENVEISADKKLQCLIRKDPHSTAKTSATPSKIQMPLVNDDVHYLTPQTASVPSTSKRKPGRQIEVPLEQRITNLTLAKGEGGVPKSNNLAQLLLQGLKSNDKAILRTVLSNREEEIIRNTVERLPVLVLKPLIKELTEMLNGRNLVAAETGTIWLKKILQIHIGVLMSNPDLQEMLTSAHTALKQRELLQMKRAQLLGRIDFILSLNKSFNRSKEQSNEKPLLVYNDRDSSDAESVADMQLDEQSESEDDMENEWEESSVEEQLNENHEDENSDSEEDEVMS